MKSPLFRFVIAAFLALVPALSLSAQIGATESLDSYLSRTYAGGFGSASVAVSVVSHGKIVFWNGYGVATQQGLHADAPTRFLLASVTKQITAMAVMMLKESRRFRYDAAVSDFFPEFKGFAQGATIRQLLQHTAGFPIYYEICDQGKPMHNE